MGRSWGGHGEIVGRSWGDRGEIKHLLVTRTEAATHSTVTSESETPREVASMLWIVDLMLAVQTSPTLRRVQGGQAQLSPQRPAGAKRRW